MAETASSDAEKERLTEEVEALRKLYAHTSRDQLGVALENAQITMSSRERVEFMDKLAKLR